MATYVNDLRLKEIATGDEAGTWGTSTNTNLELIAEAFGFGTEAITTNADTHTTTIADGSTDPGRSIFLKYTGTLDSACTITIGPNTVSKLWFIENGTSGSQNIIISQGSGANITIPNGHVKAIYSDGAGSGAAMVDAFTDLNVAGDFFVGDDLTLLSDASVLGFGADTDTTLTHVADTGILLNSTRQLQFGDSGTYIHQSADGVLDLVSDTEIEINATTIDMNGAADVSGALTAGTINGVGISSNITNFSQSILISNDAGTGTLSTASNNTGLGFEVFDDLTSGDDNTALGMQALTKLTGGTQNVAIGLSALTADTLGSRSVAIGGNALIAQNFTTATNAYNTAVGANAGSSVTTGTDNTLIGGLAGDAITTGANNTAVGQSAATALTTASNNTAIGADSLKATTTGTSNVAVGFAALEANTTASNNTAVGFTALLANTTGTENVAVGAESLENNTTGNENVAVGYRALEANTTGATNTAVGDRAMASNTTADNNTAVGNNALVENTTGSALSALGSFALKNNTTGSNSVAMGYQALEANTTGASNVAVGLQALRVNTTASNNTAVGTSALGANTTGTQNTAIGTSSLDASTTASNVTAVGYFSLSDNTTGASNAAFGSFSLENNTTGGSNTACGHNALAGNTTASNNTAVGQGALEACTTGTRNVALGNIALDSLTTANYTIGIGHHAGGGVIGSGNIAIGDSSNVAGTGNSNVTIGSFDGGTLPSGYALTTGNQNTLVGQSAGNLITTGSENSIIGRYTGNHQGLDVRTEADGKAVVSDGAGDIAFHNAVGTGILAGNVDVTGDSGTANAFALADGATTTLFGGGNSFSGVFILNDFTSSGEIAMFITGGGVITLVKQTGVSFEIGSSPSSTNYGLFMDGTTVKLKSNRGGSASFRLLSFRTRTSQ